VRLEGAVELAALSQALREIARRHEALRTRFESHDGRPAQIIDEPEDTELPLWDLSELEETEREAKEIAALEAGRAFDLEGSPVWRAALVRLGKEDHALLVCIHHVAGDGWSMGLLVREFTALYESYREGRRSVLPELPVQYADFALWQREWLSGEVFEEQLGYWRRRLAGAPALELPTDRPRQAVSSYRGGAVSLRVPAELSLELKALSRREGVTLFMTLLGAFYLLLFRYSGQEDLCVGSPIANRTRKEIEGLIGFFVNTLVLRAGLREEMEFKRLLKVIREASLEAFDYQDLPFEKLVEEMQPERSLAMRLCSR